MIVRRMKEYDLSMSEAIRWIDMKTRDGFDGR